MSLHGGEAVLLKRRAFDFLAEADHALSRGSYDVASFLADRPSSST